MPSLAILGEYYFLFSSHYLLLSSPWPGETAADLLRNEAFAIFVQSAGTYERHLVCAFEFNLERRDALAILWCNLEDIQGHPFAGLVVAVLKCVDVKELLSDVKKGCQCGGR